MLVGYFIYKHMKSPCNRVCRLNDEQICIGCGRSWIQIRDWRSYSDEKREKVMDQLKEFKPLVKSRFDDIY